MSRYLFSTAVALIVAASGTSAARAAESVLASTETETRLGQSAQQIGDSEFSISQRRPNRENRREDREQRRERFLEELNLTESQKQEMQEIRSRYQDDIRAAREEMRQERATMLELMAGTASESEIRSQREKVKDAAEEVHDLRFESMLETREVLTLEQRRQFVERMSRSGGRGRNRSGF